jgi:hypothetical protein
VAETRRVLRIGRTKTYELLAEWRETDGPAGSRVIDLGSALRVRRVALEEFIGGPVHVPPARPADEPARTPAHDETPASVLTSRQRPARHRGIVPAAQLDLFDPPPASRT